MKKFVSRSELIQRIHRRFPSLQEEDVSVSVRAILSKIAAALQQGGRTEVRGFGSFGTRRREGRSGRNPLTGATVDVPPKSIPYFKAGKDLMDRVNSSKVVNDATGQEQLAPQQTKQTTHTTGFEDGTPAKANEGN